MDDIIQGIAIYALPVIFAITLHEAAHGYVARHFGDLTAEKAGRISLNPLRHIDPFGTILLPLMMFLASKLVMGNGLLFGWAKPVPVNFNQLRQPKKNMLWVAAAGPGANLLMAFFWAAIIKFGINAPDGIYVKPMILMGIAGIEINVVLMVLNLLPLPPLDGGRIAVSLLPNKLAWKFAQIEPYGFVILLVLLVSGVLGVVLWPLITITKQMIVILFGLYV
ncbi:MULTISPECIES: site-2 protease family protein [Nitrosomonas]|uniref:Zn-dependent protease n=2 Tax=Nitrosomonas eutropha TaxID=916 RepID=A0ABX5M8L1_9PROT|nr:MULTISPECIES: site-2 protease family protein [Nitrosomonas]ABI60264.1 peptidase M50 [Nitrosomonas eutropha C91]MXS80641.1 site-2 protease family protein [Nitrosomonas sp. GH22]PXV81695.1 Zn-dependent protease [Nitrosomonas eutropha]SCX11807.1 Zn-dependent protease (includes SpoIVFB) [Nitrosomonas eutropha]SDW73353.1 Zn-dependent protease (includes SpoIVFB) [Nitrosomonas eutropha]